MRVLLSTIGTRGDVQPLVALASQLRDLGQDVHLCVPPDFRDWIESLGMRVTTIGPELRKLTAGRPAGQAAPPSPEQRRDRKSTRLNSSHVEISYAVFCLKKKKK